MSRIIDLANAIVVAINAIDRSFGAQRQYRPQFKLEELSELRVTVAPAIATKDVLGRNTIQNDFSIDVAVQQKVDATDNDAIDELMRTVQRIADGMQLKRLDAMPLAVWIRTENTPIYSPEHLDTKGVFTSVLRLTYRITD